MPPTPNPPKPNPPQLPMKDNDTKITPQSDKTSKPLEVGLPELKPPPRRYKLKTSKIEKELDQITKDFETNKQGATWTEWRKEHGTNVQPRLLPNIDLGPKTLAAPQVNEAKRQAKKTAMFGIPISTALAAAGTMGSMFMNRRPPMLIYK